LSESILQVELHPQVGHGENPLLFYPASSLAHPHIQREMEGSDEDEVSLEEMKGFTLGKNKWQSSKQP